MPTCDERAVNQGFPFRKEARPPHRHRARQRTAARLSPLVRLLASHRPGGASYDSTRLAHVSFSALLRQPEPAPSGGLAEKERGA